MMDTPPEDTQQSIDVLTLLTMMLDQMAAFAWQKLGLQPDVMSGKISQDFGQAKIAIDATVAMAAVLEPQLDESDRRRLKNLAADLKINYIQQSGSGQ